MQQKNPTRRVIRVGERVMTGVLCPSCPAWQETVIFPEADLAEHMTRGHCAVESRQKQFARYHNRGAGRPHGSKSTMSMSSTGVTYKKGIRGPR